MGRVAEIGLARLQRSEIRDASFSNSPDSGFAFIRPSIQAVSGKPTANIDSKTYDHMFATTHPA